MARVTIEDCLENVDNRFNLVLLATKRARQIVNGVEPLLPRENDKETVIALREIAKGIVTAESIESPEQPEESIEEKLAAELATDTLQTR